MLFFHFNIYKMFFFRFFILGLEKKFKKKMVPNSTFYKYYQL